MMRCYTVSRGIDAPLNARPFNRNKKKNNVNERQIASISMVLLRLFRVPHVEVGLLPVHDRVEPAVLVRLVLDRPDGTVRLDHRVEPGDHVSGPGLVLCLHVAGVRVVHVVVERIVHRLVFLVRAAVVAVVGRLLLAAVLAVFSGGRRSRLVLRVLHLKVRVRLVTVRAVVAAAAVAATAVRQTLRPSDHAEQNAQLFARHTDYSYYRRVLPR